MESTLNRVFSLANRRAVLRVSALGIIVYSVAVLIHANLVSYLGLRVWFQAEVNRPVPVCRLVSPISQKEGPWYGEAPAPGDEVRQIAAVPMNMGLPLYVRTVGNLRNERFFPAPEINDLKQLSNFPGAVARLGETLLVRVDFARDNRDKSGQTQEAEAFSGWFAVGGLPWWRSGVSVFWFAMESLIFWMGWLIFRRHPEDDSAALFFLSCIVTVGAYMGGYHWLEIAHKPHLIFVFAVCAMALPQVSLHFYLVFPTPKQFVLRYPRLTLWLLYALPGILQIAILVTIGLVVNRFRHDMPEASIYHLGLLRGFIWIYILLALLMYSGCVLSLWYSYRMPQAIHRNQVRWILAGALVASLFLAYSVWLAVRDPIGFALGGATWAMFAASLAFTCAHSFGIARYRLGQVEELLQHGVSYLLISFAGGVCYYGLLVLAVWFSPHLTSNPAHPEALLVSTSVVLVLLALNALRSHAQKVLDRRFFREKHQIEHTMRRMDEAVGCLMDKTTVLRHALTVAISTLNARTGACYLPAEEGFALCAAEGRDDFPPRFAHDHGLVVELAKGDMLQVNPGLVLPGDLTTRLLGKLGVQVARPFLLNNRLIGFLLVGPRLEGMYGSEELQFLSGLSEITTLALRGAETQRTLEELNHDLQQKVARISRQQRMLAAQRSDAGEGSRPAEDRGIRDESAQVTARLTGICGSSKAVTEMSATIRKVAASPATVLIRGESGTGKSLLADVIHRLSPRAQRPFVEVHCSALAPGVLESELFGHVKGAFTGAHRDKTGRFQMADGGTLFLDEIGDISLDIQTKLLRVLQEMTFEPVGASESVKVDVRVITATNQPLEELIRRGRFREDLFFRLNVIGIRSPALRERREDIWELAMHFLQRFAAESGKKLDGVDDDAMELLVAYDWPGNIRELENVIERAVVLTDGPVIGVADLPPEIRAEPLHLDARPALVTRSPPPEEFSPAPRLPARPVIAGVNSPPTSLVADMDNLEKQRLLDALEAGKHNKTKAARLLGIPRSTFCSKLKKFGIE